VQWDDHETRNNWYPGQIVGIDAYKVKTASLLSAYAREAMFEYNPMRFGGADAERVYRRIAYGPALDVFLLDEPPIAAGIRPIVSRVSIQIRRSWAPLSSRGSSAPCCGPQRPGS
jgi:phosphodiesterase/alkaline phosphatase D-like protein